jgi:penicillin-binding protein 1A
MTWRQIMAYAHQGIEIKPIPGVAPGPTPAPPAVVAAANSAPVAARPTVLSRRGADALVRVERLMDEAARTLPAAPGAQGASLPPGQDAVAAATDGDSTSAIRGTIVRGN